MRGNQAIIGSPGRVLHEEEMRFVALSKPKSQGRKLRGTQEELSLSLTSHAKKGIMMHFEMNICLLFLLFKNISCPVFV